MISNYIKIVQSNKYFKSCFFSWRNGIRFAYHIWFENFPIFNLQTINFHYTTAIYFEECKSIEKSGSKWSLVSEADLRYVELCREQKLIITVLLSYEVVWCTSRSSCGFSVIHDVCSETTYFRRFLTFFCCSPWILERISEFSAV